MEMGRRDLRRGVANRFSKKQSGSGFSGKSKKGMLKKLGLSGEVNSSLKDEKHKEMVSKFSPFDLENEVISTKKSRLLKKNLKETNGVDHASVPRKLRSAMKKRNLESVSRLSSAASKKLNRFKPGVESCKKDLIKKENLEMEATANPDLMTKDEEEVAATLSGLAGMFPGTEYSTDKKSCGFSEANLPDVEEAEMETSKVAEVDSSLVMEADREIAVSVETKRSDEMGLDQAENLRSSTGTVDFLDILKQNSSVKVTETLDRKLDNSIPARTIETRAPATDRDYMSNGLELWPGVSSVHSGAHLVSKRLFSTKLPPWMGQASSSSKNASSLSDSLKVKPRKLKKCASHVYITRLIKVLQTSKTLNQNESRSSEMSEHGLPDDFRSLKNSFKKVTSAGDHMISPAKSYPNSQLIDIRRTQNPKPIQDMKQFSLYSSQKQSYDFLSLSFPGNLQTNTNDESAAPNSFPQYHHQTKTFPISQQPENFHISAAYNTQLSPATSSHQVQQQHHHSPYLASRFSNAYHAGSVAVLNHQQQQLLQKRLMAAQYRPNSNQYNPTLQHSKPPNLSLNVSTTIQPLQIYSNVSQQQHRLMANAAAAMAMNHQSNSSRNYFPLVYEDTRTPLQLLCNEQ